MTPDERNARLTLNAAAESLRTAAGLFCDWLEATMEATGQDVAGNGHVASADEATGSFREAPTAPVSSSPPQIPLGAVVEVDGYAATPFGRYDKGWMDDDETCWPDADAMGRAPLVTALYHARREAEEAKCRKGQADAWCAVFDTLEVVRPGLTHVGLSGQEAAVRAIRELESERDAVLTYLRATREHVGVLKTQTRTLTADLSTALNERDAARREAGELREQVRQYEEREAACCPEDVGFAERIATLERERDAARRELAEKEQQMADALAPFGYEFMDPPDGGDVPFGVQIARMGSALVEARRELAAVQDQGLGATARTSREAPNSEESDCGIAVASPAPASAPRRWWAYTYDFGPENDWRIGELYDTENAALLQYGALDTMAATVVPVVEASALEAAEAEVSYLRAQLKQTKSDLAAAERAQSSPRVVTREEVARAALALDGHWITDDGMTGAVRVIRSLGLEVDDA